MLFKAFIATNLISLICIFSQYFMLYRSRPNVQSYSGGAAHIAKIMWENISQRQQLVLHSHANIVFYGGVA